MYISTLPDVRPVSDLRQNMAEITESIDVFLALARGEFQQV